MFVAFNNLTFPLFLQGNSIHPALQEGAEKMHLQKGPSALVSSCSDCNKAWGNLVNEAVGNTEMSLIRKSRLGCSNL